MFPFLTTSTNIVDETSFEVQLPDIKFFPEGLEDATHTVVTTPDGTTENIKVWADLKEKSIHMWYKNYSYSTSVEDQTSTRLTITVEGDKITKSSTGMLKQTSTLQDWMKSLNLSGKYLCDYTIYDIYTMLILIL